MADKNSQISKYDEIYKENEYGFDVPDYKITNGKQISNKDILTLGSGTARDLGYLLTNNRVSAVDLSSTAVRYLKNIGISCIKGDLNKPLEYKDNKFDLIIAKDILEHLENPSVLASEISRLLKPSGYAVIDVPNHFFLLMRLKMLFGGNIIWNTIDHDHTKLFEEWDYMHKIFFSWYGFQKFLKVNNLKIVKTFFDFGTLNHYSQPEMVFSYLSSKGQINKVKLNILKFIWKVFNILFPIGLRRRIVSVSPGLFTASFYVHVKKIK